MELRGQVRSQMEFGNEGVFVKIIIKPPYLSAIRDRHLFSFSSRKDAGPFPYAPFGAPRQSAEVRWRTMPRKE